MRAWAAVAAETTGCLPISHQFGLILMVGVNLPSTIYRDKAMVWPSMLAYFVNDTWSRSIPQRTRTWHGGPDTTTTRAGHSSRARDARVSRQYFASGVVYVFRRSNILGYAARYLIPCFASHTSSSVNRSPRLACGDAAVGLCRGLVAVGIRGGRGPNLFPSASRRHSSTTASVGVGGVGCSS